MRTIQIDPSASSQRRLFLDLPHRIYAQIPQWVPPLAVDVRRMLNAKQHAFYQNGEAAFFLCLDEANNPVGRLAVLNNHSYNQFNHERTAFFYLFESENDLSVAQSLFASAVDWVHSQNLEKIIGPKGFTVLDGMGLLVKGFEHRPAFGLPYNPPYYPVLLESAGFSQTSEMLSGYLDNKVNIPAKVHEVARLVQERRGMKVVQLHSRRELASIIPVMQKMYNEALEETTGNMPLTQADVKTMAQQMMWFADPRLIKIIMHDDYPIGFLLAYPDISAAVQRCRGRLFPFGWLDMFLEIRRTKWININGAGIVKKHRGMGGTALLFNEMHKSVLNSRYQFADLVQIGVENERMLLELRDMGISFYKVHSMYQKIV